MLRLNHGSHSSWGTGKWPGQAHRGSRCIARLGRSRAVACHRAGVRGTPDTTGRLLRDSGPVCADPTASSEPRPHQSFSQALLQIVWEQIHRRFSQTRAIKADEKATLVGGQRQRDGDGDASVALGTRHAKIVASAQRARQPNGCHFNMILSWHGLH